jgi:hypothetical protein
VLAVADWIIAAGALGSAFVALVSLGSAIAAWRGATASQNASREARDALALAV